MNFVFDLMPIIKILKEFSFFVVSLGRIGSNNNYGTITSNINVNQLRKQSRKINEKIINANTIHTQSNQQVNNSINNVHSNIQQIAEDNAAFDEPFLIKTDKLKFVGKESKIPATSFSRAMQFGLMGMTVLGSSISQSVIDKLSSNSKSEEQKKFSSYLLNETNAERLSRTLCKLRGASLKFGQILSTFEDIVIPTPLRVAFEKARSEADIMPTSQLYKILKNEFGRNWDSKFTEFDINPFAAASIGQVHKVVLTNNKTAALKIQYPGVAYSIDSDLNNLKKLFEYFKVFPKGLYINELVRNLGNELRMECDYIQEAEKQIKFKNLLKDDSFYYVPEVFQDYSTNMCLCSEFIEGVNIDELSSLPQRLRDKIGTKILELCLKELFEFRFMQTDPNPANFYYDIKKERLNLIDFGAAREYDKTFVDLYMKIVYSAALNDKENVLKFSKELGFLTGMENDTMNDAHYHATHAVGEPFNINNPDLFDFGNQNLTKRIYKLLPVMLKHRLKAPPTEVYSLHRKLSGCYLICIKLKARVRSKKLFFDIHEKYYK